jgi:hypothetical protein
MAEPWHIIEGEMIVRYSGQSSDDLVPLVPSRSFQSPAHGAIDWAYTDCTRQSFEHLTQRRKLCCLLETITED